MRLGRILTGLGLILGCSVMGAADEFVAPDSESFPAPYTEYTPQTDSGDKLLGIFGHSDQGFACFISPMSNPVYFEDPRTLTEARIIATDHDVPHSLGGGSVQLLAMQLRAALTDKLSLIATKDGFFFSDSALLNDGFADVNVGLKYNLFKDYDTQAMVSTGFTYEIPMGSHQALQGQYGGEFNFFLNGGKQIGEYWHVLSAYGVRIPTDTFQQSESTYWSNHLDRRLGDSGFYVFTECNWYHWVKSGHAFPAPVEGLDLFNLGSTNVAGNNIVTGAFGFKYKPHNQLEIGAAYEIPYTDRRDIIQDRVMVDLILRY